MKGLPSLRLSPQESTQPLSDLISRSDTATHTSHWTTREVHPTILIRIPPFLLPPPLRRNELGLLPSRPINQLATANILLSTIPLNSPPLGLHPLPDNESVSNECFQGQEKKYLETILSTLSIPTSPLPIPRPPKVFTLPNRLDLLLQNPLPLHQFPLQQE